MYLKIKEQAVQRELNSSHNSSAQMIRISRTFTVVITVYYVCYLPHTIMDVVNDYTFYTTESSHPAFNSTIPFTNFLIFSNSCLNPLIYSKIHLKIYIGIKHVIAQWNLSLSSICRFAGKGTVNSHLNLSLMVLKCM